MILVAMVVLAMHGGSGFGSGGGFGYGGGPGHGGSGFGSFGRLGGWHCYIK